ncbi:MAG TPA: GNAT family N-acetyltransferase [Actinomycetota bacterium]
MDERPAATIQEIAANAWPSSMSQVVDGWRLRTTPGVEARRSNSVLPLVDGGRLSLEDKLAIVDEFYAERGLPARFELSPATVPAGLDDVLAARGFEIELEIDIMVADLAEVASRSARDGAPDVRVEEEPSEAWLDTMLGVTARGERGTLRVAVLDRIAPPVRYASAADGERTIAVGMSVRERGWLGIFSMATLPEARRRGAATAILHALAQDGLRGGAARSYLQTDIGNAASHAVYEAIGFATAYRYHYRVRRRPAPTTP